MHLVKPKEKRYVIVDVDPGCDDAWAMFILLKAMECELCEVLGITCVNGNSTVENAVKNTFRVLKAVGKERTIPVYRGAVKELVHTEIVDQFHGVNGFQDIDFPEDVDTSLVQSKHAVNAIFDLVMARPKQVSLICLGPLTNLALAVRMYGELAENVKDVFIMGGNYRGVGNTTRAAEFNFYSDSEAANICLDSMKCPITILPWEACTTPSIQIPYVRYFLFIVLLNNFMSNTFYTRINCIFSILELEKGSAGKNRSPNNPVNEPHRIQSVHQVYGLCQL